MFQTVNPKIQFLSPISLIQEYQISRCDFPSETAKRKHLGSDPASIQVAGKRIGEKLHLNDVIYYLRGGCTNILKILVTELGGGDFCALAQLFQATRFVHAYVTE